MDTFSPLCSGVFSSSSGGGAGATTVLYFTPGSFSTHIFVSLLFCFELRLRVLQQVYNLCNTITLLLNILTTAVTPSPTIANA